MVMHLERTCTKLWRWGKQEWSWCKEGELRLMKSTICFFMYQFIWNTCFPIVFGLCFPKVKYFSTEIGTEWYSLKNMLLFSWKKNFFVNIVTENNMDIVSQWRKRVLNPEIIKPSQGVDKNALAIQGKRRIGALGIGAFGLDIQHTYMVLLLSGIRLSKVLVPQWQEDRGVFVGVLVNGDLFCSSLWRNFQFWTKYLSVHALVTKGVNLPDQQDRYT